MSAFNKMFLIDSYLGHKYFYSFIKSITCWDSLR